MTKDQNICYCGNYGGGMHTRSARCPGGELRTPQGEPALTSHRELPGTREPVVTAPKGNASESPASTSSKTVAQIVRHIDLLLESGDEVASLTPDEWRRIKGAIGAVETECRLWTQAEWDLKNKQVDELEQEAMRLRVLLRRFMNCRSEPPGTGWKVAAGANAGDALNKVYLDAKKHFAGSPVEPTHCTDCGVALVPEARHFSGCKSHPGERAAKARTPLRDSDAAFNLGVLPTEQPEKASEMATVRAFGTTIDPENG